MGSQTHRGRARAAQDAICGGEEIKLTYGFWDDAQRPAVEQQIAAFKELHPNVTVEPQVCRGTTTGRSCKPASPVARPMTSSGSTLTACRSMPRRARSHRSNRWSTTAASTPMRTPIAAQPLHLRGKVYGIPRDFDTIALFYNKGLFDSAGVEYPTADWTWDDLRAAAEKLATEDGSQWGYVSSLGGQQNYYNLIKQKRGRNPQR